VKFSAKITFGDGKEAFELCEVLDGVLVNLGDFLKVVESVLVYESVP
jgi:hypothetical protein